MFEGVDQYKVTDEFPAVDDTAVGADAREPGIIDVFVIVVVALVPAEFCTFIRKSYLVPFVSPFTITEVFPDGTKPALVLGAASQTPLFAIMYSK